MKTRQAIALLSFSMTAVAGYFGWQFARSGAGPVAQAQSQDKKQPRPDSQKTVAAPPAAPTPVQEANEKNAKIVADVKRSLAKIEPLREGYRAEGLLGMHKAQAAKSESEFRVFCQSLGLSDDLAQKVFQKIQKKNEYALVHLKDEGAALRRGEFNNEYYTHLRQMTKDIEDTVGPENYDEITYWQNTRNERTRVQEFKRQLNGQGGDLTSDQEAAVIDALYQAAHGKATFSLVSPYTPSEAKAAYIDEVKNTLTPVLDQPSIDLLGIYLKNKAEHPTSMPILPRTLPTGAPRTVSVPSQAKPGLR